MVDACPDEGTAVDLVPRARPEPPRPPGVPCRPVPPPVGTASPLLRAITFGARAVIVAVDPSHGWSPLSDSFGTVLGYDRHNPPDIALLELVHPEDRAAAMDAYLMCCAGRNPTATADLRIRTADGGYRMMEIVARTFVDDPDVGVVVFFGIDVTSHRIEQRRLEEDNRTLAEASAMNTQFVASVAHELRGPLSSVVAFAHLLGDEASGQLTEDQHTYLLVIDRNANRLLRLIEDLLLLSRLEADTMELKPIPTRLPDLLAAAVTERTPTARAAEVDLRLECSPGPELICDDTRLHQVVDNLINNALKFTGAGGRVTVRGRVVGGDWIVEVADSGVGIPEADLPRLFNAFFRGSNVARSGGRQHTPGTGLGLVVSRAIVELHGGTISVASTEGVGTTVTLSLPTRPARTGGRP